MYVKRKINHFARFKKTLELRVLTQSKNPQTETKM